MHHNISDFRAPFNLLTYAGSIALLNFLGKEREGSPGKISMFFSFPSLIAIRNPRYMILEENIYMHHCDGKD
jgi:hypothetical protein